MTVAVAGPPFTPLSVALERLEGAVSPLVGIVRQTMRTMHAPDETCLPNSACDLASASRTLGVTAVEYGSGADRDESGARAAAIGEALERYCDMFVPPERVSVATARALGDTAVNPARFGLFRYDKKAGGNRRRGRTHPPQLWSRLRALRRLGRPANAVGVSTGAHTRDTSIRRG